MRSYFVTKMMQFDLSSSPIYQALIWEKAPIFLWARPLWRLFGAAAGVLFLVFGVGFIPQALSDELLSSLLGLSLISFSLFLAFLSADLFFNKLKQPALRYSIQEALNHNVAEFFTLEAAKAMHKTLATARFRKPPHADSSLLLYYLLADNPNLGFVFTRANLDFEEIKKVIKKVCFPGRPPFSFPFWQREEVAWTQDLEQAILEALSAAQKSKHQRVNVSDLLSGLARHNPELGKIMVQAELELQDIDNLVWWLESLENRIAESKRFWEKKNLARHIPLAREWAAGYTITLDRYSTDWTKIIAKSGFEEIIGHESEIEQMERILDRDEINNVLLVGETGSGRGAVVRALAQKIMLGESSETLNYKRVVDLDMASLLAQTETVEQVEQLLDTIFQECVRAGNVILVIEEFHNYAGGAVRPGAVDISGVLANYLHLPQFQIIAVTTFGGLHRYVEQNPSLASLFEKVELQELSTNDLIRLLENLALVQEQKYSRFVTYPAIREIISLTERYIHDLPFPRKATTLLDEVMVYVVHHTKSSFVLPEHVRKVVTEKTQIPVGKIERREKEILLGMEELLHKRIIDQEEAVEEVSSALRRARAEVKARKGPMGSFLFLGPTGVGKTETSKALAEIYFGAESKMIRLDMSEFQNVTDIPRLLGTSELEGLLTTPVREDPFSLILLDELEKAHPNILNLFLQVLDEGWITDGLGRKVDFKNTIIIATSNAGYQIILEAIKSGESWTGVKQKLLDFLFEEGIYRPEFVNRFDAVVVFRPLSKENLLDIAELHLLQIKKNLKERGIEFQITQPLKEKIVELGYDPTFGARQMKRVIQDKVENALAKALLAEEIKRGDKVEVSVEDFSVKNFITKSDE